jgi:rfaE bifunctional protein kinase chain/domain
MDFPSRARLVDVVSRFEGVPIMVVGDMILDRFIWGRVERISPEAPVPVIEVTRETMHLGGAANVAANLVALGARPLPVGVAGKDDAGQALLREFERAGIDSEGIVLDESRATTVKTRIIAHHQQVCRADWESRAPVSDATLNLLLEVSSEIITRTSAVILSDYMKGVLVTGLVERVVSDCQELGRFLAIDPKAEDFRMYWGASVITPNKREAERASGLKITDDESLARAGDRLREMTGAEHVLITRGEEGMTLVSQEGCSHLPTVAREVFDVTGAGDTVIATLALAVGAGATVQEAAYLANHAAGVVVGKLGTASASREELIDSLENGAE